MLPFYLTYKFEKQKDYCYNRDIAVLKGNCAKGCSEHGPYSLIILNGAVATIPEHLISQLTAEGRLVTVLKATNDKIGKITVVKGLEAGGFSTANLADAATPYLEGFEPEPTFVF